MKTSEKFDIVAGILNRGAVKSEIQRLCFKLDLDCQVFESKGLIDSIYTFRVSGEVDKINRLRFMIMNLIRQYE